MTAPAIAPRSSGPDAMWRHQRWMTIQNLNRRLTDAMDVRGEAQQYVAHELPAYRAQIEDAFVAQCQRIWDRFPATGAPDTLAAVPAVDGEVVVNRVGFLLAWRAAQRFADKLAQLDALGVRILHDADAAFARTYDEITSGLRAQCAEVPAFPASLTPEGDTLR